MRTLSFGRFFMKMKSKERKIKSAVLIPALFLLLIIISLLSLRLGGVRMSASEFFGALFLCESYHTGSVILYSVRLPRILAGILSGVGLSLSGVLLQCITDNSLASPNIVGVNSGAGFGVALCLTVIPVARGALALTLVPVFAFLFALLASLLVILVSHAAGGGRYTVVLAGVAVSALLSAFISAVTLVDTDILASYNAFSIGGLSGVSYRELIIPAAVIFVCALASCLISSELNLFSLGTRGAAMLGVNVRKITLIALVCASASAAAVVSFAGLLGFVGLIVPHIARGLGAYKMGALIPISALLGSCVVLSADLVGRLVIAPSEVPVGIMMALVGAPFFIFLLIKKRGEC